MRLSLKSPDEATRRYVKSQGARRAELGETLDLHLALLEARAQTGPSGVSPAILGEPARARVERGEPALRAESLTLDWEVFARLFRQICRVAARHRPSEADAFIHLASLLPNDATALRDKAQEYLRASSHPLLSSLQSPVSNPQSPRAAARATPTLQHPISSLQSFVLNNALHPFLAAYTCMALPLIEDAAWYRAYCPVCGGTADFAALEKENGARRLLCSRCDAEWTFHRATCPFCGEQSPGRLCFYPGGDGAYRLYTCETCKRYLKTIDLRELVGEVNLRGERVLTISMDLAASGAGYA